MAKALHTMNQAATFRSVVPDEVQTTRGGYPTGEPAPSFRYVHSPSRWRVLSGRVVPALSKIPMSAGSQHVQTAESGKLITNRQRTTLEDRGFTLIPYSAAPDGISYLRAFETRPPESAVSVSHCSCFEEPVIGAETIEIDEEALAEWLSDLVASGLIAKPAPSVLRKKALSVRKRLARAEGEVAHGQGAKALYVQELKAELAAWEKALADQPKVRAHTVVPDVDDESEPDEPKTSRKKT